jgi:hypothetical protein
VHAGAARFVVLAHEMAEWILYALVVLHWLRRIGIAQKQRQVSDFLECLFILLEQIGGRQVVEQFV